MSPARDNESAATSSAYWLSWMLGAAILVAVEFLVADATGLVGLAANHGWPIAAATPEGPPKDYWSADADTLLQQLGSAQDGLSAAEAAGRLRQYGPNQVREHQRLTRARVLVNQLRNPLLLVLIFAAAASALTGEWVDAVIVVADRFRHRRASDTRASTRPRPPRRPCRRVCERKPVSFATGGRSMCPWKRSCRATSCCSRRAAWFLPTA